MKIGIIAFSERGILLGEKAKSCLCKDHEITDLYRCESGGLAAWTQLHFQEDDALIFIGSCGIAVRAVAPYVSSKISDPAVIVADELGTYAISLLSGHIGGANELTEELAAYIGALPIITTATDRNGVFAIDSWAKKQGLIITNPKRIKWISALLLAGKEIGLRCYFPIEGSLPEGITVSNGTYHVLVTYKTNGKLDALRLVPRIMTLGIGCKKNTDVETIENAYELMMAKAGCHPAAVKQVCSIDMKAHEPGILEFCKRHELPFVTFPAEELKKLPGTFSSSAFVQSVAGVGNVCERSAVLGSGPNGRLISGKNAGFGVTMALASEPYTLRFSGEDTK